MPRMMPRDGVGTAHEIAHESLQVVDQSALVDGHGSGPALLQIDAARDAGHEGLGVVGQALEDAHQVAQRLVDLGGVGLRLLRQPVQRLQPARDVLQRHGLQFSAALQRLDEYCQRRLDRLAALRKAIEEAGTVEVAETGDAGGVGVGFEVAPVPQLHKRGIHLVRGRRRPRPVRLRKHLIWSELQPVLPLGTREDIQDGAIELSFLCTDVAE